MARTRSNRIKNILADLKERLNGGFCRPGNHFVSNRELAMRYGVSYQTAHRLISELVAEGYLHRVPSSGTYIAGAVPPPTSVALVFHPNCSKNNFGGILLKQLETRLAQEQIDFEVVQSVSFDHYIEGKYNILWGQDYDLRKIPQYLQYSLMIDGEPKDGVNATFTDSISVDNHMAGQTCANILRRQHQAQNVVVLAGQENNGHYQQQLEGFRSILPDCKVFHQSDWSLTAALDSIRELETDEIDAAFSVNNVGVNALQTKFGASLPIVAFGDGQSLAQAGINGIGIPWDGIADEAIRLFRLRSEGNTEPGRHCLINPEPLTPYAPQWFKAMA
ncbi:GntR family transcriptional regulator [Cerasicoccus maritimus]|uniref:GntR family transcriptional regulator n=1 Tax=Cerasicoccus maritimus TaxID=490089 RepID=UPI002852D2A4|nr:GntR family transcriptional regulator [Cerasicoccus maritimus]